MTTWENFVSRRRIDVKAFVAHNRLSTRELFLSHLKEHGIQPPAEEFLSTLFPPPVEVKIDANKTAKEEKGAPSQSAPPPRSDPDKGKRDHRIASGSLPPEDRGDKDTRTRRNLR